MAKLTPKYELVVIWDPFLQEAEHAAELEKAQEQITRRGGTLTNADVWGRRRMAYPIQKKHEGYYVIIAFEGDIPAENLHEIERSMRLNEKILREMLTRVPEIKPRKEKVKKPKAERQSSEAQYGRDNRGGGGGYGGGQESFSAGPAGAGAGGSGGRYNG